MGILIALSLLVAAASAHAPHDNIGGLAMAEDCLSVMTFSRGGLYRSTNDGTTWQRLTGGLEGIEFNPKFPDRTPITYSPTFRADNTVFIGVDSHGLFRSTNEGAQWQQVFNGHIQHIVLSPTYANDRTLIIVRVDGKMFRSTNGGNNFAQVNVNGLVRTVHWKGNKLLAGIGAPSRIIKSTNKGATWNTDVFVDGGKYGQVTSIATKIGKPEYWVATTKDIGVLYVNNQNTQERSQGIANEPIIDLNFADDLNVLMCVTHEQGVHISTNNGNSWSFEAGELLQYNTPQADTKGVPHWTVLASSQRCGTVYAGGFSGVARSGNARAWQKRDTISSNILGLSVGGSTVFVSTYVAGLYMSSGNNWFKATGITRPRLGDVAVSPFFQTDGFVAVTAFNGIFVSTNFGLTWNQADVDLPNTNRYTSRIVFSPSFNTDGTIFAGRHPNGIIVSRNRGVSFSLLSNVRNNAGMITLAISPDFAADRRLYAATEFNGMFASTNAGQTWTQVSNVDRATIQVSPNFKQDGTLFAPSPIGLFRSKNRGQSWQKIQNYHVAFGGFAISPNFATDQLIISQEAGGNLWLIDNNDGGGITRSAANVPGLHELGLSYGQDKDRGSVIQFASDGKIYGAAADKLLVSNNGGRTWTVTWTVGQRLTNQFPINPPPIVPPVNTPPAPEGGCDCQKADSVRQAFVKADVVLRATVRPGRRVNNGKDLIATAVIKESYKSCNRPNQVEIRINNYDCGPPLEKVGWVVLYLNNNLVGDASACTPFKTFKALTNNQRRNLDRFSVC